MVNKKFLAWVFLSTLITGVAVLILTTANPSFGWTSRFGLLFAAVIAGMPFFLANKSESILVQLILMWIGRLGMWLFFGYLLYAHWRWPYSLILPTAFLPFDWWKLYQAKEKRYEEIAAQNLPPMNFNLK